ncbi:MAG: TIM barrel protein [Ardenticatenaceae bacterium]|nr:TIM barrel protein [Ardenticatenaceae bacterium]
MIQVANAPCSWGVIENTEGERKTYLDVLDEMSAAGYAGTELGDWGFMPTNPAVLLSELQKHELKMLGSWVSVRLYDGDHHAAGVAQAVKTARLLKAVGGSDNLIVIGDDHSTVPLRHDRTGRITPEMMLDEQGWAVYTAGAMKVAKAVKEETGLRSVIHPHGSTYLETPVEIETFLAMTDPDLLGMVFDTGHYMLGGGDPAAGINRYQDRIWHVHFKDFDPAVVAAADQNGWGYQQMIGQGVFPELGQGAVDFPAVLSALQEINYEGWIVVEQDVLPGMGSPLDSAVRNRRYLREIGL